MRLSPHFKLEEFTRSQYAKRHGIKNEPTTYIITNLRALCINVAEPIRERFGAFSPTSGFRNRELNTAIGGSSKSDHMIGCAMDFEIAGVPNIAIADWCANNLVFKQLIFEYAENWEWDDYDGWIHISYNATQNDMEVLTINRLVGTVKGLPHNLA